MTFRAAVIHPVLLVSAEGNVTNHKERSSRTEALAPSTDAVNRMLNCCYCLIVECTRKVSPGRACWMRNCIEDLVDTNSLISPFGAIHAPTHSETKNDMIDSICL